MIKKELKNKKTNTKIAKKHIGTKENSNQTAFKHKAKLTSNVPTSDFRPLTSSTAITLIALVITIIVLLILSAVTLNMVIRTKWNIWKSE